MAARALCKAVEGSAKRADSREVDAPRSFRSIDSDLHGSRKARENVVIRRDIAEGSVGGTLVEYLIGNGDGIADRLRPGTDFVISRDSGGGISDCDGMRRIEVHHVDEHATFESAVLIPGQIVVLDVRPG